MSNDPNNSSGNANDPTQPQVGLASWLGGGSVIIVLIAVAAMAITCGLLLDRVVRQQGLVRVQLAVASASELLRRVGEDTVTDARVLAERPTLQRLIAEQQAEGIQPLLQRYCESSRNDACAIHGPGEQLVTAGVAVSWDEVIRALGEQGERILLAPRDGSAPLWGANVRLEGDPQRSAIVLRIGDAGLLGDLGQQVGAGLTLQNFATYKAPPGDELTDLHSAALARGRTAATRLENGDRYAASMPIAASTGEVVGLLDARLSGADFTSAVRNFNRLLILVAAVVAALAGLIGVLYGRWLARPVVALSEFALRIGRGDLSAATPPVAPMEVGRLARSMDEMRRNLTALTESLRRREAEAQALLGGIVEGVYAVDDERRIRYANPQIARLLGKPESEIIGRFCGDVLQPAPVNGERPCERHCPIIAARSQGPATSRETLCMTDGGTRSTIIVSAAPTGGVQVQVLRDETELEAVRRARDSVLGNISHEFRTPLAAQLASIELLRDGLDTLDPEARRELLSNVERGVLRLMRLIDNLLESVRIEAGQLAIREQQVELPAVIRDAAELIEPLLAQRHLRLDLQLDAIDVVVRGDSQRLMQVFINLLSNAAKFAPEGSTIIIGGRAQPQQVEVWVEDEGAGMATGSAAIFERFRRGEGAEPDAPGLGLGLWIVKSIVERHQGRIEALRVQDRTRFQLTLPREAEA